MNTSAIDESIDDTVHETIDHYVAAWNATTPEAIRDALAGCWTDATSFVDPKHGVATGVDALIAAVQESQHAMGGRKIERISKIDFHHGSGRYAWLLTQTGGATTQGMTCFDCDDAGRLTRVIAFFGVLEGG